MPCGGGLPEGGNTGHALRQWVARRKQYDRSMQNRAVAYGDGLPEGGNTLYFLTDQSYPKRK
jgi:hypothetical protein